MDRVDDQRRFFVLASAVCEVALPIFRQRVKNHFASLGFQDLKSFLNHQPVLHQLFHLRYKDRHCCSDRQNCYNHPYHFLYYNQWMELYETLPSKNCESLCHCNYRALDIELEEIEMPFAGLILTDMCNLLPNELSAIEEIAHFRHNFLTHNGEGRINDFEFDQLWEDMVKNILTLDPNRQDDLIRIHERPFDARLYHKYQIDVLDLPKKVLEKHNKKTEQPSASETYGPEVFQRMKRIQMLVEEYNDIYASTSAESNIPKSFRLGQGIFNPQYTKIDVKSLIPYIRIRGMISDCLMTNFDKIVLCLWNMDCLLICNIDGSSPFTIPLEGKPLSVTAIDDTTLAVTLLNLKRVVVCSIIKKGIIRTIPVRGESLGITTINNSLVVGGKGEIIIIDNYKGFISHTLHTDEYHCRLSAAGDRLYSYNDELPLLTCYYQSGEKVYTVSLPSGILGLTSLQDGSLYVTCTNDLVYHVSSDGQKYQSVQTKGLHTGSIISYNQKRQKLLLCERFMPNCDITELSFECDQTIKIFDLN